MQASESCVRQQTQLLMKSKDADVSHSIGTAVAEQMTVSYR